MTIYILTHVSFITLISWAVQELLPRAAYIVKSLAIKLDQWLTLVPLQDIDAASLGILVQYVETGSYIIPSEGVLPLLQTSAMLQVGPWQTRFFLEIM